jgi:hypothetical protein
LLQPRAARRRVLPRPRVIDDEGARRVPKGRPTRSHALAADATTAVLVPPSTQKGLRLASLPHYHALCWQMRFASVAPAPVGSSRVKAGRRCVAACGRTLRRRSLRFPACEQAACGACFVTICAYGRESLFGAVSQDAVASNEFGLVAREEWLRTLAVRREVALGVFQVTPNRLHAVVFLGGDETPVAGGERGTV